VKNGDWSQMGLTGEGEVKSLSLDESDPDECEAIRGVVSSSRAVLDGSFGERIPDDDVRLQTGRELRSRLGETLIDKRLGVEEVEMLIRYLPRDFLLAYLRLVDAGAGERSLGSGRGMGSGSGKELGARSGVQVKSEVKDFRGGAKGSAGGKSSSANGMPIKSEEAIDDRKKIDKRLRQLGREIKALLVSRENDGEERPVLRRRCIGLCKRLGDQDHLFCSNCGGPMQDVVPSSSKNGKKKK
jgi:hypothetical protein